MKKPTAIYCALLAIPVLAAMLGSQSPVNGQGSNVAGASSGPVQVATANAAAQSANISALTLLPASSNQGGTFRVSGYLVVTTAATSASGLAQLEVTYTDLDSSTSVTTAGLTATNTGNVVGLSNSIINGANASSVFQAKAGTVIQWLTAGYSSTGVTAMQYAVHVKLEYLGP